MLLTDSTICCHPQRPLLLCTFSSAHVHAYECLARGSAGSECKNIVATYSSFMQAHVMRKHVHAHKGGCNQIVFSPSGNYAASGGQDGVIRIWIADDGSLLTELTPPNAHTAASINSVQFSEDKGVVMAASNDKAISVWDFCTGRQRFTMTGHTNAVLGICQHPSLSNVVLSCGADRMIKEWSLADGICKRTIPCQSKPQDVAFSSDGQFIVSAHFDGSLHVFDASTGSELQHIDQVHRKAVGPCVAVVSTGFPFNMVSVGRDSAVCVTNVYHGEVLHRFEHPELLCIGHQRCTPAVAPDDSLIAVGTSSGIVLLLDMKTGVVHSKLINHVDAVTCVAWAPRSDEDAAVAATVDRMGNVVFWREERKAADS
eukprot:jgi/Ulvmu1/4886/UM020_0172.1